jgi:ubiquinone/menaquinone biosynthesis C-methylase UbiE
MDQTLRENIEFHKKLWPAFRRAVTKFSLEREAEILIRFGRVNPGTTLLEVGCGTGGLLKGFSQITKNISGVDINFPAAAETHSKGLDVVQASGFQLPFRNNSFDYVICNDLIHSIPARFSSELVSELLRVSRCGVVIGMVRNRAGLFLDLGSVFRNLLQMRLIDAASINERCWSFKRMKKLVAESGGKITALQPAARYIALFSRYPWYKTLYRVRPGRIGVFGWLIPQPYGLLQYDILLEK